ncbi:hypothetical protein, partial [Streptomyces sp. NPDC007916]|uniref:hypothetical protein n=1 Tax=Streptomyces sp. NPDC007916 TaxID=3364792 RepID=UPI0036EA023C
MTEAPATVLLPAGASRVRRVVRWVVVRWTSYGQRRRGSVPRTRGTGRLREGGRHPQTAALPPATGQPMSSVAET